MSIFKKMFRLSFLIFILLLNKIVITVHFTDNNLVTDPCGIAFFKGKYHLFYQFFNLDPNKKRGLKIFNRVQWGHATSLDLFNWSVIGSVIEGKVDEENAIFNKKVVKNVSLLLPFSGSAIVDSQNLTGLQTKEGDSILLIYTSLSKFLYGEIDPITKLDFIFSTVHMFFSRDGNHFEQYPKPIVNKSLIFRNFRDPTVFKFKEKHYNLIMAENMQFGIHKSSDFINFKKTSVFKPELPDSVVEIGEE